MSLSVNGTGVTKVTVLTPWSGPWSADVELPVAPDGGAAPSGAAVIAVGDAGTLTGTIDPRASGASAGRARLRIIAGGGGWERVVPPKPYRNDGGLTTTAVLSTTAAEVGERVVETFPSRLGTAYVRAAGPASRVLSGLPWYVDALGITRVGPRVASPAGADVRVLDYDPRTGIAELATTTTLITPGTLLVDERFGTVKIRDVQQTFSSSGARAQAWCIPVGASPSPDELPGARLVTVLGAIAREACGVAHLRTYRYRVLSQVAERLELQKVDVDAPMPNLRLVDMVPGLAGAHMKVAPGAIVHVEFVGGDPTSPVVRGFEDGPDPLELAVQAVLLRLNNGVRGAARMGDAVVAGPFAGTITTGSLTVKIGD